MTKKEGIRLIWDECFDDSFEWKEMYFSSVYHDEDGVIIRKEEEPVSSLVLVPYEMNYLGEALPLSYISGVATRKSFRNQGFFHRLLTKSLHTAFEREDLLVALWPATRELYFLYDKFGFSTVFFIKEDRYTSLHEFRPVGIYSEINSGDTEEMWHNFHELENMIPNRILHSHNDYLNILRDIELDGGIVIGARNDESGDIEGIAFVLPKPDEIVVKEILASSEDVIEAILGFVKNRYPGKPISVIRRAEEGVQNLDSRGMIRIINAFELLKRVAQSDPSILQVIKLYDPIIKGNNHIFLIDKGEVCINDNWTGRFDLDVNIKVLSEILFNNESTGKLFGLPALRPSMSLMLE